MDWVYFAAGAQAGPTSTIEFALVNNVIFRSSRNRNGALIANVGRLQEGDRILLVYRRPGRPHIVRVCARLATAADPAPGTTVVQRIQGCLAADLFAAGYQPATGGVAEVIQLEDVYPCEFQLRGQYGMNSIQALTQADAEFAQYCPEWASEQPRTGSDRVRHVPCISSHQPAVIDYPSVAPPMAAEEAAEIYLSSGTRSLFDAYVMVDWSASRTAVVGANSVWIGFGAWQDGKLEEHQSNPDTRMACMAEVRAQLTNFRQRNMRVLLGFDFSFGYPRGFPTALRLDQPDWQAVWRHFQANVTDNSQNYHNRDSFAAACNRAIGPNAPGPFWGCPRNATMPGILTTNRIGVFEFPYQGLVQFRLTEGRTRRLGAVPQSVWKLNQGVSVGGQTILGIKHLADLRFDGPPSVDIRVWPFDTGWELPTDANVVLTEIFPSVIPSDEGLASEIPDRAQVRSCVRHAARLDRDGALVNSFGRPSDLTDSQAVMCCREEGWILFV